MFLIVAGGISTVGHCALNRMAVSIFSPCQGLDEVE